MARLSIRLLGPFRVTLDGEPVSGFVSDKARALLTYLAVEADRPHRRQSLAGLLWAEFSEKDARRSLSNALANVRRVIGDHEADPPFLRKSPQTIQFIRASDSWIDALAFTARVEASAKVRGAGEQAISQLEEAVEWYQGEFLEGFAVADGPAFEEWALLEREHLGLLVEEALQRLVEWHEGRSQFGLALPHARRQVDLNRLSESAHRQLMRMLALSGRRGAALAQFDALRKILAEELGVEPAAATTSLCERIRAGQFDDPAPLYSRPFQVPSPRPIPRTPSPLPPQPHSQHVNKALSALIVMMQNPDVRSDVAAFGADFESARHHAGNLIDCKFLHDRLHDLDLLCYTPISMEAGRFPEHDAVVEILSHYESCLQEIADDLKKFAERPDCEIAELWWVEQVFLAHDLLRGAISNLDADLLKEALQWLRRVLTTQPTRINARLSAAAESLRLSTLVKDMELLSEGLASLESEPERLIRFKTGVGALASLERSMTAMVKEHNQWQRLDLELRRIEAVIGIDTEELEASWPELKALSEALHHDRTDQWATRFRESIDRLDCAIAARKPGLARQRFREFYREASHRFYRVDRALKKHCEDLDRVGEPLTAVLEMLQ